MILKVYIDDKNYLKYMIGKLKGIIDEIDSDKLLLDVHGVCYIIYCSKKTLSSIPNIGSAASLFTNMQVKEDDISLYGFLTQIEQEWFNNLITVQGIGPKLALVILSFLEPQALINTIANKRKEDFKHITGVGPKLAERVFTELHKKASSLTGQIASSVALDSSNINDALVALTNLGYNRNEAYSICKNICYNEPEITIHNLIKAALKELSK